MVFMPMAPMSTKVTVASSNLRNLVSRPTEKMEIPGQKSISKMAKTLRRLTKRLLEAKAQILLMSVGKFTIELFQVCLLDPDLGRVRRLTGDNFQEGSQPHFGPVQDQLNLGISDFTGKHPRQA